MNDKAQACGSVSSTELGPVGWRYVTSEVWGDQVLTQNPKAAQLARDFGRNVEPLYTEAQLLARVAAERERICAAIKAADDESVDDAGYMLDSTDCISIVRGTWPNTTINGECSESAA
jgi:hypothetical protein